jgi:hypothetical protein
MTHKQEIALADEYGATYKPDKNRGGPWCRFELNDWTIWECSQRGKLCFATAILHNSNYVKHAYHDTLAEAFEHAQNT